MWNVRAECQSVLADSNSPSLLPCLRLELSIVDSQIDTEASNFVCSSEALTLQEEEWYCSAESSFHSQPKAEMRRRELVSWIIKQQSQSLKVSVTVTYSGHSGRWEILYNPVRFGSQNLELLSSCRFFQGRRKKVLPNWFLPVICYLNWTHVLFLEEGIADLLF